MILPVSIRTGTLTQRMRSGYLIIARMLSSSPSAFAARSKFSSATSYAFITFVAVANMANLNSEFHPHGSPKQAPRQGGATATLLGTDQTAMNFRRLLPEIRWQSGLSPPRSPLHFQHNPPRWQSGLSPGSRRRVQAPSRPTNARLTSLWGSQSWLQPAFSRPLPSMRARSRPEKAA